MKKRIRVGIIFGGKSAEHEVSLRSARNVYEALDKEKYEPILIGISKDGRWKFGASEDLLTATTQTQLSANTPKDETTALVPLQADLTTIDVIFPVLHGTFGEEGSVQGLLKLAGIPFVGSDVLGSAIGMDKDVMKRLLKQAGIPIVKFKTFKRVDREDIVYADLVAQLGKTLFIKPANLGSSVGVAKVTEAAQFEKALDTAFQYDNKILIEQGLPVREIECGILGNDEPMASLPGEVVVHHDFYTYDAKYIDPEGADVVIPADIPDDVMKEIQKLAIQTFKVLCCQGLARVDFFLTENNTVYVNEINTIPGFTSISMYPKLWEQSGISYTDLISKLLELAIERNQQSMLLKTSL